MTEPRAQAETYAREARRLFETGDHYEALIRQRRAVALIRDAQDPLALARAVRDLADMLVAADQAEEAGAAITEMLALYRAAPAPAPDLAEALRSAARQAEAIDDTDTAWIFLIQARARYEELGAAGSAGIAEIDADLARLRG